MTGPAEQATFMIYQVMHRSLAARLALLAARIVLSDPQSATGSHGPSSIVCL